jgi:hypothetical protein
MAGPGSLIRGRRGVGVRLAMLPVLARPGTRRGVVAMLVLCTLGVRPVEGPASASSEKRTLRGGPIVLRRLLCGVEGVLSTCKDARDASAAASAQRLGREVLRRGRRTARGRLSTASMLILSGNDRGKTMGPGLKRQFIDIRPSRCPKVKERRS